MNSGGTAMAEITVITEITVMSVLVVDGTRLDSTAPTSSPPRESVTTVSRLHATVQ